MKNIVLGSIMAVPLTTYFYHGFDKKYPISESKLPAQSVLYIQHVGEPNKIADTFQKLDNDLKGNDRLFANGKVGAIFYNNSTRFADSDNTRVIVGVFLPTSDRDIAEEVQKKFPDYELKDLPAEETVKSVIPYTSKLTNFWWALSQYPRMYTYIRNNFEQKLERPIVVEFYGKKQNTMSNIESHVPYGPSISQWLLRA